MIQVKPMARRFMNFKRFHIFTSISVILGGVTAALFQSCGLPNSDFDRDQGSDIQRLGTEWSIAHNGGSTTGEKLGLQSGDIALTLDDGPVPESLPLAKWLSDQDIPITYFMIGRNVRAFPEVARAIAALPGVIIANHSMDHKRKSNSVPCIACDGSDYAIEQVMNADEILNPFYEISQVRFFFFRAPGGNFFRSGNVQEERELELVNRFTDKYVGPVRWDIDGDVNPSSSGGCIGRTGAECAQTYLRQIASLGQRAQVILAHDASALGRDTIRALVPAIKARGYRFAALDENIPAVERVGRVRAIDRP